MYFSRAWTKGRASRAAARGANLYGGAKTSLE
jgi:hypothetical protein